MITARDVNEAIKNSMPEIDDIILDVIQPDFVSKQTTEIRIPVSEIISKDDGSWPLYPSKIITKKTFYKQMEMRGFEIYIESIDYIDYFVISIPPQAK